MAEEPEAPKSPKKETPKAGPAASAPPVHVAPSPHLSHPGFTTRRMMLDVLIALVPLLAVALWVFRWYALKQLAICVIGCMAAEALFTAMRRRPLSLGDLSAVVTGVILAFSLPATAPWYVGVIGAFAAIGLGKVIFGGLGMNIFNPAMVGRAFVMIAFTGALAAPAYVAAGASVDALTQATPMTVLKIGKSFELMPLLAGTTNGSLGETSALACLAGGLCLCLRRTAAWEIPLGMLAAVAIIAGILDLTAGPKITILHHLLGGAVLFGAFFIATDPVSSPLTPKGRLIFGAGVGVLVMLIRILSAYPEGVMFSVLLMNGIVPLINRWTVPTPVGGPMPVKQ